MYLQNFSLVRAALASILSKAMKNPNTLRSRLRSLASASEDSPLVPSLSWVPSLAISTARMRVMRRNVSCALVWKKINQTLTIMHDTYHCWLLSRCFRWLFGRSLLERSKCELWWCFLVGLKDNDQTMTMHVTCLCRLLSRHHRG